MTDQENEILRRQVQEWTSEMNRLAGMIAAAKSDSFVTLTVALNNDCAQQLARLCESFDRPLLYQLTDSQAPAEERQERAMQMADALSVLLQSLRVAGVSS